jgi:hypothetical protein
VCLLLCPNGCCFVPTPRPSVLRTEEVCSFVPSRPLVCSFVLCACCFVPTAAALFLLCSCCFVPPLLILIRWSASLFFLPSTAAALSQRLLLCSCFVPALFFVPSTAALFLLCSCCFVPPLLIRWSAATNQVPERGILIQNSLLHKAFHHKWGYANNNIRQTDKQKSSIRENLWF